MPATYEAVTGEVIEAQQHNDPLEDLEQDMNTARPIVAGGTGATTAVGGHDAFSTKGSNVASATTCDIGAASGMFVHITGTTTITGFGTKTAGVKRICVFDGALTLTHDGTSLILPGGANITTAAGDAAHMVSEGSGNWRCVAYVRANGSPLAVSQVTLVLKQGSDPTPTAEGDAQWDTDDNVIVVGDGAGQKIFVAIPASTAAGDLLYLSGARAAARLAKGTAGQALRMNSGATAPVWGSGGAPDAVLEDQKSSGTAGGSFTSGAWRTRTLNTEAKDTYSLISISSNEFTPTVNGWVEWSAPAYRVNGHQTRLYNVTDATAVAYGTGEQNSDTGFAQTCSVGGGAVVAGKTYRIEHQCAATKNTDGLGFAASFGTEVYTRVQFWAI